MDADFMEFQRIAARNNVMFFFSGYFTQDVIATSVETIRTRLNAVGASLTTRRRVLSSFVELSQNIVHYSSDAVTDESVMEGAIRLGTLCITACGNQFGIVCANPVEPTAAAHLAGKLTKLRAMSMPEIERARRSLLRAEKSEAGSKGAGLGLLTLARDAMAPIEFRVEPDPAWGQGMCMFYLKLTI